MRIKDNPFYILGVSPEDTLDTIESVKDDKCFMDGEGTIKYEDARDVLSYPQKRLEAEVRWFYSDTNAIESAMSPNLSDTAANFSLSDRELAFYYIEKMYNLSPGTFLSAAYNFSDKAVQTVANYIKYIDERYTNALTQQELEKLYQDINYARAKASIPRVNSEAQVENALQEALNADVRDGLKYVIANNSMDLLIQVVNNVVASQIQPYCGNPVKQYHDVIRTFLSLYNEEIQGKLDQLKESIFREVEQAKYYTSVEQLSVLLGLLADFSHYAWPLQVYFRDNGQNNGQKQSIEIADKCRNLSINFANEKKRYDISLAITRALQEHFSELPDFMEKVKEDISILEENAKLQEKTQEQTKSISGAAQDNSQEKLIFTRPNNLQQKENNTMEENSSNKGLLIIGALLCIFFFFFIHESSKPVTSSTSQTKTVQSYDNQKKGTKTTNQKPLLDYSRPPVGSGNVLSMSELRWVAREQIYLDTMKSLIKSQEGIDAYNKHVNDYNDRAAHFRYRKGEWDKALEEVNKYRTEIEDEAKKEVREKGWDKVNYNSQNTYSAEMQFRRYHQAITAHDLRRAFLMFTPSMQSYFGDFNTWADGYRLTVLSQLESVHVISANAQVVQLAFRLKAVDRLESGTGTTTAYFEGECKMVLQGNDWKIDEIVARKVS